MGSEDLQSHYARVTNLGNGTRMIVVASPANLAVLSESASADELTGLTLAAHAAHEPLPSALFRNAVLAIIEVDPQDRRSLDRISAVREQNPELDLVAAINDASVSLVRTLLREGISDVVALPFDPSEIVQVILDVSARRGEEIAAETTLAPVTVVARSIGGCGATSLATHLAAELAARDETGRGTLIVDLDIQLGAVADYLGVTPRNTISDLLTGEHRLDEELVRSVATDAGGGLWVIGAPRSIVPLESIDTDVLLRLLTFLRRQYAHVVLDLPANWTNWALSAALAADTVLLVVELSVASLRQAKRRLELFDTVGIDRSRIKIVVNRAERRLFRSINLEDVATTLGHPVLGSLALDAPLVSTAQNQGVLVGSVQRKSRYLADVAQLTTQLQELASGSQG
ncbi:AAA family ATPase [Novosphingobium ginsenosidimutans]|uniref:AAA family ATPase n=1 Tax=Novosphingobium ginsenosidimutans TaxID=1176536 RepID=A0A5B8S2D1_9SPHN|nr:AAA family ATPase [Novosphingobium ginsenosidimutans]QEA15601.1 AAA family ATPase [Novosphingobium ginsenosidimutans]